MMHTISSDGFCAAVSTHGAELCSLKDKDGYEYIWTAEEVWQRHAPVLFPFVCNTETKKYTVNGSEYSLSNHGFARDSEFVCADISESSVVMEISSDANTRSRYPYDFKLAVSYTLTGGRLHVLFKATNIGSADMPFFIGGHPGFLCPFEADRGSSFEDYDVVYEKPERITQDTRDGSITVLDGENTVHITRELFKNDVFMKDKPASSKISLVSRKSGRRITVDYDNSGCIAVWSPYDDRAGFVCLEPWASAPVYCCDTTELTKMPHAKLLRANESYDFAFTISITDK